MDDPIKDEEDASSSGAMLVENLASFDDLVVWNHDKSLDEQCDPASKGVNEWLAFAQAVS